MPLAALKRPACMASVSATLCLPDGENLTCAKEGEKIWRGSKAAIALSASAMQRDLCREVSWY